METAEIKTGNQRVELRLAAAEALTPRRTSIGSHAATLAQFLAVVAQFGLIVMVVNYWQLDSRPLARLMALAFAGFVIHHLLPVRFRLPFFAMLSLVAVITGVGHFGPNIWRSWLIGKMTTTGFLYHLLPGSTLIGIGLGLIG